MQSGSKVFSKEVLYPADNGPRVYKNDAAEAAFLLGGIGAGNFSIGARGELRDWEIFNHSGKGVRIPYTFFSIWAKKQDLPPVTRILEARLNPPFSYSHGFPTWMAAGLPRLDSSELSARYPFVNVDFADKSLPATVSLEAFTPFIPLDPDNSGIPAGILRYKVKNPGDTPLDVSICCSMANVAGLQGKSPESGNYTEKAKTRFVEDGCIRGLFYTSEEKENPFVKDNSTAVTTNDESISYKAEWLDGNWTDGIQDFWDDFSEDGKLNRGAGPSSINSRIGPPAFKVGSLAVYHTLAPGEERVFEFCISWYFPTRNRSWDESNTCRCSGDNCCCPENNAQTIRNYYAVMFSDAVDASKYLHENLARLEKQSRDFTDAIYGGTFPPYVIDAVTANITVLRSPTCFRLENGTFCGWEGCGDLSGCCEGTCTHVWNYAQTLAFLFPSLERTMRENEFLKETDETGKMSFRSQKVFDRPSWGFVPAADGQMGAIIRLYREWKLSGDDGFLKSVWDSARRAMDFAFTYWDSDGDCVLDSEQHNTYDIEFYGPNSLVNSMFFGALSAMAKMAEYLSDTAYAEKCRGALEKGSGRMDGMLWGDGYYIQKIDDVNKYKYQYGKGCLADQLLGQFLAHVAGLGYILPENHVKEAVHSIFEHNFQDGFSDFASAQRTYALNDEKGLLLCTWPNGGRPILPMVYADEVWTGIEYQVASHLIYEGYIDEGLTIVKALRDRHDGYKRNPWNEVECGHHYARSMASWGLITALSGFDCDMTGPYGKVSFSPRINREHFSTFWSTGKAWGVYKQDKTADGQIEKKLQVLYGEGTQLF